MVTFLKSIGSLVRHSFSRGGNHFLQNRQLIFCYKKPYNLAAPILRGGNENLLFSNQMRPEGFEPPKTVPKTVVISISPRARKYTFFKYIRGYTERAYPRIVKIYFIKNLPFHISPVWIKNG